MNDPAIRSCPRCGGPTEIVGLSGGGRIGWFCHDCEMFIPEGPLTVW